MKLSEGSGYISVHLLKTTIKQEWISHAW